MIFIFITLLVTFATILILIFSTEEGHETWVAIISAIAIFMCFMSTMVILPLRAELYGKIDKLSEDNTEQIQLAIDSVNYAHKTMDEFNDARFQNTAQESYLLWELLHSIYKQDSIRWYKEIRTSPEYKELDRFLVGDWEDFYLY